MTSEAITFNKSLTGRRYGRVPNITFRELPDDGNPTRYQGSINVTGVRLIKEISGKHSGLSVLYSDEHSIIGFKALHQEKGVNHVFGATQLFKDLNLVTGKHYLLKHTSDGLFTIDSDEFN